MNQSEKLHILIPVLIGLSVTIGGVLLGAVLLHSGRIGEGAASAAALIPYAVGSLLTALLAARMTKERKLPVGFLGSAILFGLLLILSLCWMGTSMQPVRIGITAAVGLGSGLCGGLTGAAVRTRTNKRRKK
ncbi:MAG: TIGR04086 family membrane protein [Butyricicoccaceae bacterium]